MAARLTIGRSASCDWPIPGDPYVSQLHASLEQDGDGRVWLRDEGSVNGTRLNGVRVWAPVPVAAGDVIRVGRTELRVPE